MYGLYENGKLILKNNNRTILAIFQRRFKKANPGNYYQIAGV